MNNVGASLFTIAMEKYGSIEQVGKSPVPHALFWYQKGAALGDPTCQNMVAQLEQNIFSQCTNCSSWSGKTGKGLSRCGRCKSVYYYGSDCQKKHWAAGHKIDCYTCPKK
jgi:hypothetical protein